MLAGSPGTALAAQVTNLGDLVVLDGLVAAGMPPRQSRPVLVFCKYGTYSPAKKYLPVQIKCDLAQQPRTRTRTETWPRGHEEHHTRILVLGRISLRCPGYSATRRLELHKCHSLPAQSQLLILKQCHCHQLALIRTWSTQFLEPTAETCNKIPIQPDSLATLAGSAFDSTVILPFSPRSHTQVEKYCTVKTRSSCTAHSHPAWRLRGSSSSLV